jgi:hypothetical protein
MEWRFCSFPILFAKQACLFFRCFTMAGALGGALRSLRPVTQRTARVFLERNPYLAWETQRPVFSHPVFNGVVHTHLPHWEITTSHENENDPSTTRARSSNHAGGSRSTHGVTSRVPAPSNQSSCHPNEPAPNSRSWLPRVSRLGPMEGLSLPEYHVQTISAAHCVDVNDATELMRAASDAGASTLLFVSGDRGTQTNGEMSKPRIDSLALLNAARLMKQSGDIDPEIKLACVANPCLERALGKGVGASLLEAKITAGAEMVITQPDVVPTLAREWRDEIGHALPGVFSDGRSSDDGNKNQKNQNGEIEIVGGVGLASSSASAVTWMRLVFGQDWEVRFEGSDNNSNTPSKRIKQVLAEYALAENTLDADTLKAWGVERAELAVAEVLCSQGQKFHGVHLMPITSTGYDSGYLLADAIATLVETSRR